MHELHPSRDEFCCYDCGHDTKLMRELYMVLDDIWIAAVRVGPRNGNVHMLCMGCLEGRLGLKLQKWMFTDAPLNWEPRFPKSDRLSYRMGIMRDDRPVVSPKHNDGMNDWNRELHERAVARKAAKFLP